MLTLKRKLKVVSLKFQADQFSESLALQSFLGSVSFSNEFSQSLMSTTNKVVLCEIQKWLHLSIGIIYKNLYTN
jgi:hypothetical protein